MLKSLAIIRACLTWRIQSGTFVRIGDDPWIGCGNAHRLYIELKSHLNVAGITHIYHIADPNHTTLFQQDWKYAHFLHIPQQWAEYTVALTKSQIIIFEGEDEII